MIHLLKSYFKFLWNSKNAHGVHSPFVFDLATKCFYDKKRFNEYGILENYRNSLLENANFIEVKDFGAGSRVFKSDKRQVSQIAKTAGITPKRARLLFRVANYFKPENILEIGTSLGLATSTLSLGNPKGNITTLEGCPETAGIAKLQSEKFGLTNINFVTEEFKDFLEKMSGPEYKLIYFDGNHKEEATLQYFEMLLPTISNGSVWIFDDIHWSPEMERAWETIKKHPKVTVTIDTFQWGFVFFRKEQVKEHFVIRAEETKFLNVFLGARTLWGLLG